jgi:hypothetical protein
MRWILAAAAAALLFSTLARADATTDAEIKQLEAQLQRLQHEQQSLYQQFQMIQELRRTEQEILYPPVIQNSPDYNMDNPPPNYDDMVREKQERQDRIKQYTGDLYAMYARYRELDEQKKALLDKLNALVLQKQ